MTIMKTGTWSDSVQELIEQNMEMYIQYIVPKYTGCFLNPKREVPGRHLGGIWGAKTDQKWIQNRDGNSRAKKEALERDLASIWELPKGKKY